MGIAATGLRNAMSTDREFRSEDRHGPHKMRVESQKLLPEHLKQPRQINVDRVL